MDLSSLNVDVLLHLIGFVKPVDRLNLALSGILKGFENVNEGFDLHERFEDCEAELGLRRGGMCELEIRSLKFRQPPDESFLKILEWLAGEGYLPNNRRFEVEFDCSSSRRFVKLIASMKNLETLRLFEDELTPDDLAHVFQSCSKLTELFIATYSYKTLEIDENLKIQLKSGFQKLRCLDLVCFFDNDKWPFIQEMMTWLKECIELRMTNFNLDDSNVSSSLVIDGSLTLDPNLAKSLQSLDLINGVPAVLVEWIMSASSNIHTLQIEFPQQPNGFHNEIARLKKMKKLDVRADKASDLREIFRSCRQVEILSMDTTRLTLRDLAEWGPAENLTDFTLCWNEGPSLIEVLPILKRWRNLSRLTVQDFREMSVLPFEVLSDFIMGMKHLSHLQIYPDYDDDGQLKILRDKVNELILPRRPNFKFGILDDFLL